MQIQSGPDGTLNEIIFAVFFSCTPAVLSRHGAAAAHVSGDAGGDGGPHRRGRSSGTGGGCGTLPSATSLWPHPQEESHVGESNPQSTEFTRGPPELVQRRFRL
jgi:hypothetical protein